MSGRSAYVRKKITEPKTENGPRRSRTGSIRSRQSSTQDDAGFNDPSLYKGMGSPASSGRLLKFSHTAPELSPLFRADTVELSIRSSHDYDHGNGRRVGPRDENVARRHATMSDHAYPRPLKPVHKTEDVSGIARSGFRSTVDKKSEEVRRNLTKAFSFGSKKKKSPEESQSRATSSATNKTFWEPSPFMSPDVPPVPAIPDLRHHFEAELQQSISPPPSSQLPPLPPVPSAPPVSRWIGGGLPVQKWNKLRRDPEIWDPSGDVLVYFGSKDQIPRPNPSFRLSSNVIEATGWQPLLALLREGFIGEEDVPPYFPPSPLDAPPMLQNHDLGHHKRLTPPLSEDVDLVGGGIRISFQIFLNTPKSMTKIQAHRHAITTRNVFAMLYQASLVGYTLCQALSDLQARLETYKSSEADNVGTILNYLSARSLDDPRDDPEVAVSLLAWSESSEVRWEEGWREAFLHCAGMYPCLESCPDFARISPISKALLDRAYLETQLRVQAAEDRLAQFGFDITWPHIAPATDNSAHAAADRLRLFFLEYYTRAYGSWPPPNSPNKSQAGDAIWLNRNVAQRLQRDFGALYDYLVDRKVTWDESETRSTRKWMMVSEDYNKVFEPDTTDLAMTDVLVEYDNRMRFPHIPHPFPLIPDSIPLLPVTTTTSRFRKEKSPTKGTEDRGLERRIQLAYTEATNIFVLCSDRLQSGLIDSFVKFEKSDLTGVVDPSTARRGRWVLIYAVLQTLASVSVDSPNVRYKDGVTYHLSPRLKGTKIPPWKGASTHTVEAAHELSYCWTSPLTWRDGNDDYDSETSKHDAMHVHAQTFPQPPQTTTSWSSRAGRTVRDTRNAPSLDNDHLQAKLHTGSSEFSTAYHSIDTSVTSTRGYATPVQDDPRFRRDANAAQDDSTWKIAELEGQTSPVREQAFRIASRSPTKSPDLNLGRGERARSPRAVLASYNGGLDLNDLRTPHFLNEHRRPIVGTNNSSNAGRMGLWIKDFDVLSVNSP